jgi:site-specific recombinase XerD
MADTGRKRPVEVLSEDEVRRLLTECSRRAPTGVRDRALLLLMYKTGLRVEEALDLKPADIDHRQGSVRVLHGKWDRARTVGVDDGTLAVVELWEAKRRELGVNGRTTLFCTLQGGRLSPEQVRQMIKRRADKAGITKRVHPHALRHTYASQMADEGVPVHQIQRLLGHRHLATTALYIEQVNPTRLIEIGRGRAWQE